MSKVIKNYCFTAFLQQELDALINYKNTKYICWGDEICPKTKRLHYQGYVEFDKSTRIPSLKKIAKTTHFEPRKGTQQEAIEYCMKDESFHEIGEKSDGQGHRTDLDALKQSIKDGMNIKDISDKYFSNYLRYEKSITKFMNLHQKKRDIEKCNLEIHIGPPGSGKSFSAKTLYPDAYWMPQPNNNSTFFDGYAGEKVIIIDDFYGWIEYSLLLKLCDRYPLTVQTKGGMLNMLADTIIITSNKSPDKWYPNIFKTKEDFLPFARRITLYKDDYKTRVDMSLANNIADKLFDNPYDKI